MLPPTETDSDAPSRVDDACTCVSVQARLNDCVDDTDPCVLAHLAECATCRRDAQHRVALLDRLQASADREQAHGRASDALRARISALIADRFSRFADRRSSSRMTSGTE